MQRLSDTLALITGAEQGIGLATAQTFIKHGAQVILSGINHDLGQTEAAKLGKNALYIPLDVRDAEAWKHVFEKYPTISVLVNNAGITGLTETTGPHDPENLDIDSYHAVLNTNLHGTVLGCKFAIAAMKKLTKPASIINISSRSGIVGVQGAAAYAVSKAGVRNHTKSVALHCADQSYQIRCNSIHPAAVMTPIWDAMLPAGPERDNAITSMCQSIPLKEMGQPEDVANACLFLASHESRYITGAEINIDGGILAGSSAPPTNPKS